MHWNPRMVSFPTLSLTTLHAGPVRSLHFTTPLHLSLNDSGVCFTEKQRAVLEYLLDVPSEAGWLEADWRHVVRYASPDSTAHRSLPGRCLWCEYGRHRPFTVSNYWVNYARGLGARTPWNSICKCNGVLCIEPTGLLM